MEANITRFMEQMVQHAKEAVVGHPRPPYRQGEEGYADWVILAILRYREREEETYRSVVDKLKEMGQIRASLEMDLDDLPDPSTVCRVKTTLRWRCVARSSSGRRRCSNSVTSRQSTPPGSTV